MAVEGYFIPGDPGADTARATRAGQAKDARTPKSGFRAFVKNMLPVPSGAPKSVVEATPAAAVSQPSRPTRRPAAAVAR